MFGYNIFRVMVFSSFVFTMNNVIYIILNLILFIFQF